MSYYLTPIKQTQQSLHTHSNHHHKTTKSNPQNRA